MKTKVLLNTDIIDNVDSQATDKPVSARAVFLLYKLIRKCPFRVGDVFATTLTEPPNMWPDTEWELISSGTINYYKRKK